MANLKLTLDHYPLDGETVTFKAPCDCTGVTGVIFAYPGADDTLQTTNAYSFLDSHKNVLAGLGNLFSEGAYVSGVINHTDSAVHLLNADTNGYLEEKITETVNQLEDRMEDMGSADCASFTVILTSDGWTDNGDGRYVQTVAVEGVTESTPIVMVDVALYSNNTDVNKLVIEAVYQTEGSIMQQPVVQGAGTLTFYSSFVPEVDISLYVGVIG